jgi:hypothetical protein
MSAIGGDGQPISCFMLRYEDFLAVKDEAKRYGLKYGVIIDMDKPQPDDEVALFINQNDAIKLERILDSLRIAVIEPDLSKVEVEDKEAKVVKAKVDLQKKESVGIESEQKSIQEEKQDTDPLAASPFVEKLLKNEKDPSVRKEIDRIAAEMEAEEKKQYGKRKSGKSSNEAYIKTKTKKK